jgi:3-oxo-5alpha-steroid 4-dehydrogenase
MDSDRSTQVVDPDKLVWDEAVDVLVVGFGGTGACAAIEAADQGASVLTVDRFTGGGATSASGGVYYGGGTRFLREAGFEDTPTEFFKYSAMETGGVVSERTLKRFCDDNVANLEWLASLGMIVSREIQPRQDELSGKRHLLLGQ